MRIDVHHHFHFGDDSVAGFLQQLIHRSDTIMATLEQLTEATQAAAAAVQSMSESIVAEGAQVTAAIEALKAQIGAGQGIDPAALDPVLAGINAIQAAAASATEAVQQIFTPESA